MRPTALVLVTWLSVPGLLIPEGPPALAQLIQIEPGYVRAPFVEVHSYPDGSSYVRAPFVSVHSPPRYLPLPRHTYALPATQVLPATPERRANFADLDWKSLRQQVRDGVARLDRALAPLQTHADWHAYLLISQLRELTAQDIDTPPDDAEREQLGRIAARYDATARATNLRRITSLDGFRTVEGALAELVQPPLDRQWRLLVSAGERLQRDLQGRRAGAAWQDFLRLPPTLDDSSASPIPPPPGRSTDRAAQLEDLQARYRQVDQDPRYRQIAELPGFRATYRRLADYLDVVTAGGVSEIEQLPPPLPLRADEATAEDR